MKQQIQKQKTKHNVMVKRWVTVDKNELMKIRTQDTKIALLKTPVKQAVYHCDK